jgi:DNA polymerase-3 subunit alpha
MDEIALHRNMIIGNLEKLLAFNKEARNNIPQNSLFGSIGGVTSKLSLSPVDDVDIKDKLAWEKELLGLYISGHPLNAYKDKIDKFCTLIKKIKTEKKAGDSVTIAAIIDDIRVVLTKKNTQMAFLKLSDYSDSIEAVIFTKQYETSKDFLIKNNIIALQGKVSERNGEKSVAIDSLKKI